MNLYLYVSTIGKLVKFENGEVEKSFQVKILDDKNKEETEEFGIRLIEVDGSKFPKKYFKSFKFNVSLKVPKLEIQKNPKEDFALKLLWGYTLVIFKIRFEIHEFLSL